MAKKEEFDAMGQPVGTPREETQSAETSTLTPLVDVAPKPKAKAKAAAPDIKATASQDPGLRKILNLPADSVPPSGHYQRNYRGEPALRVYGGVEVEHEPGFEPLPPGYLTKFVAEDTEIGKTDDPKLAALDAAGKPVKTEEYKSHLDAKANGKRLGGNVRFDIEAGDFTPGDVGVAV